MPAPAGGPVTARTTTSSGAPSSPREAEGSYRLKDGGVFDYTLCFIDTDGSQDNIIATYTFQIDLSGYTITADE